MSYETILFEEGSIARITLNRPDRLNSFTAQMHEELRDALGSLGDARVVVKVDGSTGKPATITFTLESPTSSRIQGISVQYAIPSGGQHP